MPRNQFEESLYEQIKSTEGNVEYERNRIPYTIKGVYIPDFKTKRGIYIEAKGWLRPADKRKMRAVKDANPSLDIRFIFQKKSASQIRWAEKYGFPYAVGVIPKTWLSSSRSSSSNRKMLCMGQTQSASGLEKQSKRRSNTVTLLSGKIASTRTTSA
jgi:hypothetical protein